MKYLVFGGNDEMKKVCLVSGSSPSFLGGISLYQRNLINYACDKKLNLNFTWVYPGDKNREYNFEGINCVEIKSRKHPFLREFYFAKKVKRYLERKEFEIINSHANWGYCLKRYFKKKDQKIIHTYHGVTYPYMKIQFAKFGFFKYLFYPILPFFYILEKVPFRIANKIICVSEKVKKDLQKLYGARKDLSIIRTGVNLTQFINLPKESSRKELKLDKNKIYGLYSGRGGYWNKGLDRAINLSREIYALNENYRLIVIGADENKCGKYLNFPFVEYRWLIERKNLLKYYSASDFFFSLSRYEGGAPTLALSEAIASECLVICSKDSEPEILENEKDCLVIDSFEGKEAKKIFGVLGDQKKVLGMKKLAKKKIEKLSLEKWGKRYFEVLLK